MDVRLIYKNIMKSLKALEKPRKMDPVVYSSKLLGLNCHLRDSMASSPGLPLVSSLECPWNQVICLLVQGCWQQMNKFPMSTLTSVTDVTLRATFPPYWDRGAWLPADDGTLVMKQVFCPEPLALLSKSVPVLPQRLRSEDTTGHLSVSWLLY